MDVPSDDSKSLRVVHLDVWSLTFLHLCVKCLVFWHLLYGCPIWWQQIIEMRPSWRLITNFYVFVKCLVCYFNFFFNLYCTDVPFDDSKLLSCVYLDIWSLTFMCEVFGVLFIIVFFWPLLFISRQQIFEMHPSWCLVTNFSVFICEVCLVCYFKIFWTITVWMSHLMTTDCWDWCLVANFYHL